VHIYVSTHTVVKERELGDYYCHVDSLFKNYINVEILVVIPFASD
jgi:hypothetical protein